MANLVGLSVHYDWAQVPVKAISKTIQTARIPNNPSPPGVQSEHRTTREPVAQSGDTLRFRLPFGASYLIEAVPPAGYRIIQPWAVRIGSDDTDKTIEFRMEKTN